MGEEAPAEVAPAFPAHQCGLYVLTAIDAQTPPYLMIDGIQVTVGQSLLVALPGIARLATEDAL